MFNPPIISTLPPSGVSYQHLKGTVSLKGQKVRRGKFIMAEGGTMLRDKVHIREQWARRPLALSLGDERAMDEMTGEVGECRMGKSWDQAPF